MLSLPLLMRHHCTLATWRGNVRNLPWSLGRLSQFRRPFPTQGSGATGACICGNGVCHSVPYMCGLYLYSRTVHAHPWASCVVHTSLDMAAAHCGRWPPRQSDSDLVSFSSFFLAPRLFKRPVTVADNLITLTRWHMPARDAINRYEYRYGKGANAQSGQVCTLAPLGDRKNYIMRPDCAIYSLSLIRTSGH